jgi:hypothetical protein
MLGGDLNEIDGLQSRRWSLCAHLTDAMVDMEQAMKQLMTRWCGRRIAFGLAIAMMMAGCGSPSTIGNDDNAAGVGGFPNGRDESAEGNAVSEKGAHSKNKVSDLPPPNAQACLTAADCGSGFCIDGVCCDSGCAGTCQACTAAKKGSGVDGVCGFIKFDTNPNNECAIGSACDGSGTCKFYNGVPCPVGDECLSYCVDGVCCGNICDGTCQNGSFASKVDYPGGDYSIAAADLNGDGKVDLATVNYIFNTVSVLFNNGNGTFTPKVDYPAGNYPNSIVAADMNGDGISDLAFTNDANVNVLFNYGDGTFAPRVNYPDGSGPIAVAAVDLNGDGHTDLAIANRLSNNVSVRMNQGGGVFGSNVVYPAGILPLSMAAADLNGDGKPDLAVANEGPSPLYQGTASVLLNNGDGTFGTTVSYATGKMSNSVSAADLNADGKPDLAVTNLYSQSVSVLINSGNGTFAANVDYTTSGESLPNWVTTADLNGDGSPDLAITNHDTYTPNVNVLLNRGNGTFSAKIDYSTGSYPSPYAADAADFNGDSLPDLAVANYGNDDVSVLLNQGNGSFGASVEYPTGKWPQVVAAADLNGDSMPDIVVGGSYTWIVSVLLNNGSGTFAPKIDYLTAGAPRSIALADLNGDGTQDIVVGNEDQYQQAFVSVLMNKGDGTFAAKIDYSGGGSVAVADFNGDGKQDLAVTPVNAFYSTLMDVEVRLNQGNGTFGAGSIYPTNNFPWSVTGADVNGDGNSDLVITDVGVSVLMNNGNGTFAPKVDYPMGGLSNSSAAVVDLNGDGNLDIAATNYNLGILSVLVNNGNGTFAPKVDYAASRSPRGITSADFNGDMKPDLAVANEQNQTVSVLLNTCLP